ncbi:cactus-binding C-terminus of cactin protein-domain-containing protein [Phakopsora pachyrhizi]|uniref:Splicing factor Cactin n=1 Tax=Phakopsora pachyrhizi TaxID=170000 RepID=A0AAV0AIF5_PHAPC|nr:cactus-binding C-terminus of cactin protein-domain-containing protein [Phakopsora pachyrhizi]
MRVIQKYERDFNKIDTKDAETNCLGHSCLKNGKISLKLLAQGYTKEIVLNHDLLAIKTLPADAEKFIFQYGGKVDVWMCVCNDALSQSQNERTLHHDALTAGATVRNEITHLLQGKNYKKLIELESNIEVKLAGDKPIDPEYWDSLLVQLNVGKAKAKLKVMKIKSLIFFYLMKTGIKIINERQMVLNTCSVSKVKPNMNPQDQEILDRDALAEKLYAQEAEKRLVEVEEVFELEAETGRQSYNWEDKYRPCKPCYFNKVRTGYKWNKYNQTHYDTDNPPPKVVQGYSKHHYFYVSEPQLKEVVVILTYISTGRVQHLLS